MEKHHILLYLLILLCGVISYFAYNNHYLLLLQSNLLSEFCTFSQSISIKSTAFCILFLGFFYISLHFVNNFILSTVVAREGGEGSGSPSAGSGVCCDR